LDWATAIRLLRRRLFLTPAQLAAAIGADQAAVWGWETGADKPSLVQARALQDLIARSELAAFDMASLVAHVRRSASLVLLDDSARFVEVSEALCRFYKRNRSEVVDRTNSEHMLDEGFAAVETCKAFTKDRGIISARIVNGGFDACGSMVYTGVDAIPLYSGTFGMAVVYLPYVISKAEFESALFEHGKNFALHHVDAIRH
jgi:DNA-binding XRE family transcriptional regulator